MPSKKASDFVSEGSDDPAHLPLPRLIDGPRAFFEPASRELDDAVERESALGLPDVRHPSDSLLSEKAFAKVHDQEQYMLWDWKETTLREFGALLAYAEDAVHGATTKLDDAAQRLNTRRREAEDLAAQLDEPDQRYDTARDGLGRSLTVVVGGALLLVEGWALKEAFVARHLGRDAATAFAIAGVVVPTMASFYAGLLNHRAAKYEGPARVQRVLWVKCLLAWAFAAAAFGGVVAVRVAADTSLSTDRGAAGLESQTSPYAWLFYVGLQAVQLVAAHEGWKRGNPRVQELRGARAEVELAELEVADLEAMRDERIADLAELEDFDAEEWTARQSEYVSGRYSRYMLGSRAVRETLLITTTASLIMLRTLPTPVLRPPVSGPGRDDDNWVSGPTLTF